MSVFYIDPVVKSQFFPDGGDLSFWLDSEDGALVLKDPNGRELRRIEADDRVFF